MSDTAVITNSLNFEDLRTSIDALCDHYLDHNNDGNDDDSHNDVIATDTKETTTETRTDQEEETANSNENKHFVFSRILQKIFDFYSRRLHGQPPTTTPTSNDLVDKDEGRDNVNVTKPNNCDNSLIINVTDAGEGEPAKFNDDDMIEYAFTSEETEVLLLLKANERPESGESQNYVMPVQEIVISSENGRMRVALGVLFRLLLPLFDRISRGWQGLRAANIVNVLSKLHHTKGLLTTLLAYAANTVSMSLSSVQVANRIDPLLRVIKLRRNPSITKAPLNQLQLQSNIYDDTPLYAQPSSIPPTTLASIEDSPPPSCVTCVVLAEPPEGVPIRADIIFIHGLHGSLVNTWKQGLWNSEGKQMSIKRPPKPPVRPPKRPRRSRSTIVLPTHNKRPRFAETTRRKSDMAFNREFSIEEDDDRFINEAVLETESARFTYECEAPDETDFVDDVEYSFPTFRLRVEDSETDSIEGSKLCNDKAKRKVKVKKDENWSACWPGDWLPLDCPGVRVIALNYTTDPYLWRPTWVQKQKRTSLAERAREMAEMLIEKKVGQGHPIVWVGHSKGGIFIKQILVDAWDGGRPAMQPLWQSSRGVLFYSVPHRGAPLAEFKLPLLQRSIELTEIQKNCPGVLELHRKFVALYRGGHLKIDVFSFVETALTLMSVLYLRIVGVDSADPGIGEVCGVHLDHREICKPRDRTCILYTELVKMINKSF